MAMTIVHKGIKLAYEDRGAGKPAFVFIHGWTCDRSFFAPHALGRSPAVRHQRGEGDVGTPITLPLRPEQQDGDAYLLPPPSLVGVWDNFPLLHGGAGGLEVTASGAIEARHPFALRHVLDLRGARPHGNVAALTAQDENDLLAYLLTL